SRIVAVSAILLFLFLLLIESFHPQATRAPFPLVVFYLCVGAFLMFLFLALLAPRKEAAAKHRSSEVVFRSHPDIIHSATAALSSGNILLCRQLLDGIESHSPDYPRKLRLLAELALRDNNPNAALDLYQKAAASLQP